MSASPQNLLGHLFAGGIAFMLLCALAVGLWVTVWGAMETAYGLLSRSWPTTEGRIESVSLVEDLNSEYSSQPVWSVRFVYSYEVDDKQFAESRQRFDGGREAGYDGDKNAASAYFQNHQQGARIPVRYNPRHPARAVLEPGLQVGALFLFAGGAAMLLVSATMILAIWRALK